MPGRSCTGNPNHTGTVSMPCHNTWLLCLPANFQQKHKVDRGETRTHTHSHAYTHTLTEEEEGERGREAKGENAVSPHCHLPFAECFWGLVEKIPRRKMSSLYPNSCQKWSFQLSRHSRLSQNNIHFFFFLFRDKENIPMVIQKGSWKLKNRGIQTFAFMWLTFG